MRHTLPILLAVLAIGCTGDPENGKSPNPDLGGMVDAASDGSAMVSDTASSDARPVPDSSTQDMGPAPDMRRPEVDMGTTMLPAGVCGNMIVESGETCDDCSSIDCEDGSACTVDFLAGDPSLCAAYCRNDAVTHCESGDGCCPPACVGMDDDCSATCGDMILDALETCDGDCPADCDDQDASTRDVRLGSDATCNVECVHLPIMRCINGDGYCPVGCLGATDDDCASLCGNGVIEADETCDPPESCTNCDDGNPCTSDEVSGSAATCDVSCSNTPVTACTNGDGCCGAQCDSDVDSDCSPTCGDRTVQLPETCDGPPQCNAVSCNPASCETATRTGHHQSCNIQCGYTPVVGCTNGDGCCPLGCTASNDNDCDSVCGNGVLEPGELCDPQGLCEIACPDDTNACTMVDLVGDPSTCDARCEVSPVTTCGLADDCCPGNCSANDDPDCVPTCGNNVVEAGETCDGNCPNCEDGLACTLDTRLGLPQDCNVTCEVVVITNCGPSDGCCPGGVGCQSLLDPDCAPVCGNGLVESGELCDGNCPASCSDGDVCTRDVASGSAGTCDLSCSNPAITACVADGCCAPGCNANNDPDCTPVCGNNVVENNELCDGNCPATCSDGLACTADALVGSSGNCDAECVFTTITSCTNGDGCCPSTCTNLNDSDCP